MLRTTWWGFCGIPCQVTETGWAAGVRVCLEHSVLDVWDVAEWREGSLAPLNLIGKSVRHAFLLP